MPSAPQFSTTVRLHGDEIRRLRESKGLTQLYVAEFVGVTVDTVSRWENNRTSAVKRENAAALASALGVELAEIIRAEEAESALPEVQPGTRSTDALPGPRPLRRFTLPFLAVLSTLALVWGGWRLWGGAERSLEVERSLPAYSAPNTVVPVLLRVKLPARAVSRAVLRDRMPPGWTFVAATLPPDTGPDAEGLLRWVLNATGPETRVVYLARAPADVPLGTRFEFRGAVVTGERSHGEAGIAGPNRTDAEQVHWADDNGDFVVSDAELLHALDRIEAAKSLGLTGEEVRALWGAGGYRWDPGAARFVPGAGGMSPSVR